ncbi:hypothetical protein LXL04_034700 [Taraxacum kok-saghyz]
MMLLRKGLTVPSSESIGDNFVMNQDEIDAMLRITGFKMMVDHVRSLNISKHNQKLLHSLCYSVLWFIWRERNEKHFGKRIRKPFQLADDIQLCTYNWVKNRGKMGNLAWAD